MNDSYFFAAAPPQQPFYVGLPPTPSYSDLSTTDKVAQDLDPAAYIPYDAFSFPSLAPDAAAAASPPLQHINSVDSGIGDLSDQHHHQHHNHNHNARHSNPHNNNHNHNHAHNHASHLPHAHTHAPSIEPPYAPHPPLSPTPTHPPPSHTHSHSHTHSRSSSSEAAHPPSSTTTPLTPAQSRRKAQNRAAQRAFRERKERHVRELEAKLAALESASHALQTDNERLKLLLQRAKTENEILRATTSGGVAGGGGEGEEDGDADGDMDVDVDADVDVDWDVDEAYTAGGVEGGVFGARTARTASGYSARGAGVRNRDRDTSLTASATWDLIQKHPLVAAGKVDVADVCERLRGKARCDGQGPVFEAGVVWRTIEESGRGAGDELI